MNTKLTFVAYPAIAMLSLAAVFSAHAQSANDAADQAAYGATVVNTSTVTVDASAATPVTAARSSRTLQVADVTDQAAYGATVTPGIFLRSRTEVRAEAVAAREAGYEALVREGADPQYAVLPRAKAVDGNRVLAGAPAPVAK
jgi:hypothetical protein